MQCHPTPGPVVAGKWKQLFVYFWKERNEPAVLQRRREMQLKRKDDDDDDDDEEEEEEGGRDATDEKSK